MSNTGGESPVPVVPAGDAVARTAGAGHPDVAVRALLAHALQSWARLGPRAALPAAARARQLTSDAEPYLRACAGADFT